MLRHPHSTLHYRPHRLGHSNDEQERFSSFQSHHSDGEHEEFSDFETSREKEKTHPKGQSSCKREKSHILIEQLPLQCDKSSLKSKPQYHLERSNGKKIQAEPISTVCRNKKEEKGRLKQTLPLPRYNYMEKIERHLSTIAQDNKQYLRESALTSLRAYRPDHASKVTAFDPIWPNSGHLLHHDPNIVLLEKQRMEMLLLQQENITLRERVFALEKQIKFRDEQRIRKEVEGKMISMNQEESMSRKEAKLKLVEEVATLQARCREMKEEMRQYKQKQEETFAKLFEQRESAKLEVVRLKNANQYQTKFTEVFLNMVEKLPVDLEQNWSKKRKIAVGWKVVKHLVKKAFKLGIHPPSIAS